MIKRVAMFYVLGLIVLSLVNVVYAYTEQEYKIYQEVMDTPMSISEKEAHRRVGKKYGISAKEVDAIVERVMKEIYSGGSSASKEKKQKVEDAVNRITEIKHVIISGDFANVSYTHKGTAWTVKDVKNKVLNGMPKILESIFTVQGIERARLTAYFPVIGSGEKKVAIVECYRFDFSINKAVNVYDLTVYPLR